jgi:hypothetical protein
VTSLSGSGTSLVLTWSAGTASWEKSGGSTMRAHERSPDPTAGVACSNKTQGGREEETPVEKERRRRPETAAERASRRRSDIRVS